jgi:hypothetical protein
LNNEEVDDDEEEEEEDDGMTFLFLLIGIVSESGIEVKEEGEEDAVGSSVIIIESFSSIKLIRVPYLPLTPPPSFTPLPPLP